MAELSNLGRYQLRRVLGKGAMGVVYDGYDPTIDRRVAVKTILKNHAIDEEVAQDYSARFVREARAAGRINHPNIVQIYDFGEQEDVAYLVMEFIQGRELRSFFVAKEAFAIDEAARIMCELLDALDFAHEAGVIHRDVKPANVMLDSQRRVKLADFGVARIQDSDRSAAGTMVGTPAFMSPEQISGKRIDRRTDIFSAGSILYQLLTGEQPFKGDGTWTVAKQIMQDDPPLPSMVLATVPNAFDGVVNKALAKDPAQRFANAREFADAVRGALVGKKQTEIPASDGMPKPKAMAAPKASDAEVEFWRTIQNSDDPEEFRVYIEEFPDGTYVQLARLKIAKLRETGKVARTAQEDAARLEAEAKAKREAEVQAQREAQEQAQRRQAEEKARHEAAEKLKRETEARAKREAEDKARREAEEKAKREAEDKARREAEEKARREAEEKARHEAEAKREAEDKARREAAAKLQREIDERARRDTEEKVRQAQVLAKLRQQEAAAARAKTVADEDATVAVGSGKAPAQAGRKTPALPIAAAAIGLIGVGIAAFLFLGRTAAPPPVAQAPAQPRVETVVPAPIAPPKAAAPAAASDKARKESEERARREQAEKAANEQAAKAALDKQQAAKAAAEKAAAEKSLAAKALAEKAAQEKQLAARAVAEKTAAEKANAEKAAAERAALERAASEKAAADRAAAEKAAADKAAAEKAVVAKAAPAPAAPAASTGIVDGLVSQAAALEREGKMPDAVRVYMQAARSGSGQAAKRLGEIYYNGAPGVSPDGAESAKWYNLARARGVQVGPAGAR